MVLGKTHSIVARLISRGHALPSPLVDNRQGHTPLRPAQTLQNAAWASFLLRMACCMRLSIRDGRGKDKLKCALPMVHVARHLDR
jgi:ankyrin repeat protein